jgi:hypothetical protein
VVVAVTSGVRTNDGTDLQNLAFNDRALNKDRQIAMERVFEYLNTGNEERGRSALEVTKTYVAKRKAWLEAVSLTNNMSENYRLELKHVEHSYQALMVIYEASTNYTALMDLNTRCMKLSEHFSDTYDYDIGIHSIQETEKYLNTLETIYESVKFLNMSLLAQNSRGPMIITWINNFPYINSSLSFLNSVRQSLFHQKALMTKLEATILFRDYIDPPVYILILLTGLVWNIILLFMFAQKKEIRTAPNIMIFNIVVADVLNLTFNLPLQYFGFYYPSYVRLSEPVCVLFISLRCMFTSASALSVVALSAQRFCATLPAFHSLKIRSRLSSLMITVAYILLVWAVASSIVLADTLREKVCDDNPAEKSGRKSAKVVSLHEFLVYCFALPGIMFIFTVLTARRLKQSAKEIPGDVRHKVHEDARNRGAKVVTALCVVFIISYFPFFMWGRIATTLGLDRLELPYRILDNITYYLLFSNPCFNPLALYVTSHTFRRLFNCYLFGWCRRSGKLHRTDTQISYDNTTQSSRQQESDV